MLRRHELSEPALWTIARIVHEADIGDDEHTLRASEPIFDGLFRLYSPQTGRP